MTPESLPSGVLNVADLLPCPFCGVTPVIERCADSHDGLYGERKWWGIKCRSTLNRGGTCAVEIAPQASIEAATERWNRRASPPPQATGAQPHPEPSEEASSLPVYAFHLLWPDDANGIAWNEWYEANDETLPTGWDDDASPEETIALVRLSDAQSQLNAMRAERDKWYQEAAAQAASAIAAHEELAALKSDMADMLESVTRESLAGDKARAALAALRAALASPEGSPR